MDKKEKIEEIKASILLGFLKNSHPRINGKHVSCDVIPKNFPTHERGLAKKARNKLIKDSYILERPSKKGYSKCSLNREKIHEILTWPKIKKNVKHDEHLKKLVKEKYGILV